jgi:hypothetical protein
MELPQLLLLLLLYDGVPRLSLTLKDDLEGLLNFPCQMNEDVAHF